METNHTSPAKDATRELLLQDYRYLSDSFWKNEQTGETRVNWFIGIVTAAGGGLFGLTSAEHRPHGEPLRLIFVASLFALLAFGVITLFRIVKRNIVTDGYKRGMDVIREAFVDHFDGEHVLLQYHPLGRKKKGAQKGVSRRLGGLTHSVLTINSLLIAGLAAVAAYPFHDGPASRQLLRTYLAATAVFVLAFAVQFFWVRRVDRESRLKLRAGDATHAGGIVYRLQAGKPQYLLVGPKKEIAEEWIFPKGHIDRGEEPPEAAVREVREETGVLARVVCLAGRDQFKVNGERVVAKYYLMERFSMTKPEESRRCAWLEYETALVVLTHCENKYLLQEAERKRRAASG
jgi:8-oxo-dGTP pyrophosphatase MutT (NUDIX family)